MDDGLYLMCETWGAHMHDGLVVSFCLSPNRSTSLTWTSSVVPEIDDKLALLLDVVLRLVKLKLRLLLLRTVYAVSRLITLMS